MLKSVLDLWSPNTQDQILKARRRSLGKFGNLPIEGTVQLDNQKRHLNLLSLQESGGRWEHTLALTNSGAQLQQLQQRHVQKSQDESSQSDAKNHSISSYVIIFAYICHICQDCHKYYIHKSSQIQVSDAGSGWPRWNGGIRHHSQHLKVQRSIEGSSSRQNQGKNCKNGKDGKVSGIWIKWHVACVHHVQMPEHLKIPTPIEGEGGGGTKPTCRIPLFFAWKPWDSDPAPRMEL